VNAPDDHLRDDVQANLLVGTCLDEPDGKRPSKGKEKREEVGPYRQLSGPS